jgi:hypothetical protein
LLNFASFHELLASIPESDLIVSRLGSFGGYFIDIRNASTEAYSTPSKVNALG